MQIAIGVSQANCMKEPTMIVDLWFSDLSGPLRAEGNDCLELLRSVGKENARESGVLITRCKWIKNKDGYVGSKQPKTIHTVIPPTFGEAVRKKSRKKKR